MLMSESTVSRRDSWKHYAGPASGEPVFSLEDVARALGVLPPALEQGAGGGAPG
jgi:hypothetical protein